MNLPVTTKIADAIESLDWSGTSIGAKEILKAAVKELRLVPRKDSALAFYADAVNALARGSINGDSAYDSLDRDAGNSALKALRAGDVPPENTIDGDKSKWDISTKEMTPELFEKLYLGEFQMEPCTHCYGRSSNNRCLACGARV